jgi:HNH endonuclease
MHCFGSEVGSINNSFNIIPLRPDMHRLFDPQWFTIVPKTDPSQESAEVYNYHNTLV